LREGRQYQITKFSKLTKLGKGEILDRRNMKDMRKTGDFFGWD
jgi:hypothetical protein